MNEVSLTIPINPKIIFKVPTLSTLLDWGKILDFRGKFDTYIIFQNVSKVVPVSDNIIVRLVWIRSYEISRDGRKFCL